jgi:phosphonate transport system permease protein
MPVYERNGVKTWKPHTALRNAVVFTTWVAVGALVVWCWQLISEQTTWMFVQDAPRQAGDLFDRMIPPRWGYTAELLRPLWDTVNIATIGTGLAIVLALPVALMAARTTTPHPIFRALALFIIVASRSVHSLVWALFLVYVIGPGVFAGIIAIALRSIGFIAKLLNEAIEETDASQIEAIRATGAGGGATLVYAIVPQVLPAFAGITVFRWDINIREATFLGLVGAGGIGLQLNGSINSLRWADASVILVMIFLLVLLSEWVSARVRSSIG